MSSSFNLVFYLNDFSLDIILVYEMIIFECSKLNNQSVQYSIWCKIFREVFGVICDPDRFSQQQDIKF